MPRTPKPETTMPAVVEDEPKAVVLSSNDWSDFEDVEVESDGTESIRIKWPSIKITAATSQSPDADKHGGEFWHSDREAYTTTLEVAPLRMTYQQSLFAKERQTPLCMSVDGVAPLPNQPLWRDFEYFENRQNVRWEVPQDIPQPAACVHCPFYAFGPGGENPACSRSVLVLVERKDAEGGLAQLRLPPSNLKAWKNIIQSKHLMGGGKRWPMYAGDWVFKTVRRQTGASNDKTYYELLVESFTRVSKGEFVQRTDLMRSMRAEFETVQEASLEYDEPTEATARPSHNDGGWGDASEPLEGDIIDADDLPFS